jgi:signal transduction histidine kinase/CheY-like chemotaxis protein
MTHNNSPLTPALLTPANDLAELRRSLRDLVALTMLPTVWAGYEPSQICVDLVDVVARMVDADGVYLHSPTNGCDELLRLKREGDAETEDALRAAAAEATIGSVVTIGNVQTITGSGQYPLRLLASSLSFQTTDRFVVAARRAEFPNETERLLLRVAANQASTWLDWKRAEAAVAALAVDNARLYGDAQEANRAKDEFLANLSHELRTPMTAILGWAHLLQVADLEPDQVKLGLQTIRQSGEAQAKLIDDLLDVSRIVTGKLHLNPTAVRLSDIARSAIAAIHPAADAKRHNLEVDILAGDAMVLGDASRLQQVFWNLLSNAVKFTPPGGVVRVRLVCPPAEPNAENVVLTVEDTGEGIPQELLPLVFERFRQAATSVRGRTGLGLGLAIAKELVEMHGGSISATSGGRGRGSTFSVTLPRHTEDRKPREQLRPEERPHEKLRSLRVLLVEDDQTTRTLLTTLLGSFGAEVTSASCAADAEAALRTFDPQILITDIEMPGNDGIALLHRLRAIKSATLPAIAVSGYADEASRDRVLTAGFIGFVAKPLDPNLLADEIVRALAVR